jgi:YVTN family beta-propeller protein
LGKRYVVELHNRAQKKEDAFFRMSVRTLSILCAALACFRASPAMELIKTIHGNISPKSIGHSGNGLFFVQNMMYRHSITVYDRQFRLVKTIPDSIELSQFGFAQYSGFYRGAPVEVAFSDSGRYAWVSNYLMYGPGFSNPGNDTCSGTLTHDASFVYCIDTRTCEIVRAVRTGSVPKFLAATPDSRLILVSNWCSYDVSIVDAHRSTEIRRIKVGRFPRGIAITAASDKAYIGVVGSYDIAVLNLTDFSLGWLKGIGRSPRHLVLDPSGKFLYATLNGEGKVAKVDLVNGRVLCRTATGAMPRSMAIASNGAYLYVTNYSSHSLSKVRTGDMRVVQEVFTDEHPIGVTYDPETRQVWVACYTGSIMVFQD